MDHTVVCKRQLLDRRLGGILVQVNIGDRRAALGRNRLEFVGGVGQRWRPSCKSCAIEAGTLPELTVSARRLSASCRNTNSKGLQARYCICSGDGIARTRSPGYRRTVTAYGSAIGDTAGVISGLSGLVRFLVQLLHSANRGQYRSLNPLFLAGRVRDGVGTCA